MSFQTAAAQSTASTDRTCERASCHPPSTWAITAGAMPAALHAAFDRGDAPLHLQHPELPGLSAVLDTTPGGFVLRLLDTPTPESVDQLSAQALAALQKLSRSEQRVARLVVKGLRNDQVAERLCRSPRTVEFQLNSTFRKLGVRNRVQLSRLLA